MNLFDFFNNEIPNPVNAETLRDVLNDYVSPIVFEIGLEWNGKSKWIGPSENGIRKVLKHKKGKELMGCFVWGMCYDFLPMVSGKKIVLQRTFKSSKPQLYKSSTTTNDFLNGKSDLENGVTSTWGEKECRKSISNLILKRKNEIFEWYENGATIEGSLNIANKQIGNKNYDNHRPNPKYVASFLYAKMGDKEKGIQLLNELQKGIQSFDPKIFEKLKKRLIKL